MIPKHNLAIQRRHSSIKHRKTEELWPYVATLQGIQEKKIQHKDTSNSSWKTELKDRFVLVQPLVLIMHFFYRQEFYLKLQAARRVLEASLLRLRRDYHTYNRP